MVQITIKNVSFKVHKATQSVNVFVYNPNFAKGDTGSKTVRKALKFFWGTNYRLQTDVTFWNAETSRFLTVYKKVSVDTAPEDNKQLDELARQFKTVLEAVPCYTPEDFFNAYKASLNVEAASVQTVLGYAIYYRDLWKSGKMREKGSRNYTNYDKLIHKLQGTIKGVKMPWANGVIKFANMPIANVDDEVFKEFCKFVRDNFPNDYWNNVKRFRAIVYHYQQKENDNPSFKFGFRLSAYVPECQKKKDKTGKRTLTQKEFNELKAFDVDLIHPKMKHEDKQLCIDMLLLQYYLASRPVDILQMRIEDIKLDSDTGLYAWFYCPEKKKNYDTDSRNTPVWLAKEPLAIIQKYKGTRKSGYLLPFSCNVNVKTDINKRLLDLSKAREKVNRFFKSVCANLGWSDINVTTYTMRRTIITNMAIINPNKEEVSAIAKTSVHNIQEVYTDKRQITRNIRLDNYYM